MPHTKDKLYYNNTYNCAMLCAKPNDNNTHALEKSVEAVKESVDAVIEYIDTVKESISALELKHSFPLLKEGHVFELDKSEQLPGTTDTVQKSANDDGYHADTTNNPFGHGYDSDILTHEPIHTTSSTDAIVIEYVKQVNNYQHIFGFRLVDVKKDAKTEEEYKHHTVLSKNLMRSGKISGLTPNHCNFSGTLDSKTGKFRANAIHQVHDVIKDTQIKGKTEHYFDCEVSTDKHGRMEIKGSHFAKTEDSDSKYANHKERIFKYTRLKDQKQGPQSPPTPNPDYN